MKTEMLRRPSRPREVRGVSPALQELAPLALVVADAHGKPVPLSSAGHVLHFGKVYQARLVPQSEGALPAEVALVTKPSFFAVLVSPDDVKQPSQPAPGIRFRVVGASWWRRLTAACDLTYDDLEIGCRYAPAAKRPDTIVRCPVVVRFPWTAGFWLLVLLGALVGLLPSHFTKIASALFWSPDPAAVSGLADKAGPPFWLNLLLGTGLTLAAALVVHSVWGLVRSIVSLVYRSRELKARYRAGTAFVAVGGRGVG